MKIVRLLSCAVVAVLLVACSVSYKLNGASIDYNVIKTITLESFTNRAAYQWGPMVSMFKIGRASCRERV